MLYDYIKRVAVAKTLGETTSYRAGIRIRAYIALSTILIALVIYNRDLNLKGKF